MVPKVAQARQLALCNCKMGLYSTKCEFGPDKVLPDFIRLLKNKAGLKIKENKESRFRSIDWRKHG